MAVMTTPHSEGVALEQKIMPVPSSDAMALDLDINGNSNHDDPTFDPTPATSDIAMNNFSEVGSADDFDASNVEINGDANLDAYSSNKGMDAPLVHVAVESQQTELSTSGEITHSSPLLDSITTATEVAQLSNSPEEHFPASSSTSLLEPSASESAINTAVDDNNAMSSVLPVIEATESNLRDTELRLTPVPDPVTDAPVLEQQTADLNLSGEGEVLPKTEPVHNAATVNTHLANTSDFSPQPLDELQPLQQSIQHSQPDLEPSAFMQAESEQTAHSLQPQDTDMVDASEPTSTSKIAREREDDTEAEPSAKRTKMADLPVADLAVAAEPVAAEHAAFNGELESAKPQSSQPEAPKSPAIPITSYQSKEIIKILKNSSRTTNGKNFRDSVRTLWPTFADAYESKVTNPIDLGAIEGKLRDQKYNSMDDFKEDLELLYNNAKLFNGAEHTITAAAREVRDSILTKAAAVPAEPAAVAKAIKNKPRRSTPVTEIPPRNTARRPSRSAGTAVVAPPAPTFALDPTTSMPLIRRDSNKEAGGRPKREIHPPKNKDLIYSVRPKSKKYATELRFCEEVLNEMKKNKHHTFMSAFLTPVDPVALGIPNYFAVIKTPMDISTVTKKLIGGDYTRAADFEKDMRQISANCLKYNPVGNPVREMGVQFDILFNAQWAKKDQYIHEHTPAAHSPSSSAGEEDEESEEEEEVEAQASINSAATLRLIEEQNKLITLMASKKTDPSIVNMQQEMVEFLTKKVEEENARAPPPKKTTKKAAKAPKTAKKAAPVKKAGGAGGNKKGGHKRERVNRYLGTLEKEVISAGLGDLPDVVSGRVLDMIKNDQPGVDEGTDGTLELDIDSISIPTLWKIYELVMQHVPDVEPRLRKALVEKEPPRAFAKPISKKKNKPMSKHEQERKIEQLKNTMQEFERQGSGSQEPVLPTVEQPEADDSSGDEDSDSEEE